MKFRKTNIIYIITILIYSCGASKKVETHNSFYDGIVTKNDCLTKNGIPDFKYTNAFTNETWAYKDSITHGVHCFSFYEDKLPRYSWYLNFEYPDTIETIYKSEIDSLNRLKLVEGEYLVKYIGGYGNEYLIKSFLSDSVGILENQGNSTPISVGKLNKALNQYKIYSLGSIKKNLKGNMLHVGLVQIWIQENEEIYYITLPAVSWFDIRYEATIQEIWKLLD